MDDQKVLVKKQWFTKSIKTNISDHYEFDNKQIIGSGSYGNVVKAIKKDDKTQKRAIKIIKKNKISLSEDLKNEIEIMRNLDHPNVIKLYDIYEDERFLYLVMELCEGGELFDRIIEKSKFTENEARKLFLQMILSINYMHSNKLTHRDLKPENFLLITKEDNSPIKTIDFGLSRHFETAAAEKVSMNSNVGTPYYIAPEVLAGSYNEKCDIWSAGVILYIMLSGIPPFNGKNDYIILDAVKKMKFSFIMPHFKNVSDSAKDLITRCLAKQDERLTSSEVLKHPWLTSIPENPVELEINWNALKSFQSYNKFKKVVLYYIATQLSEKEILEIGDTFKSFDANGDGVISFDEFKKVFSNYDIEEIKRIYDCIDIDNSGGINYNEFLAATMEKKIYSSEEKLNAAFKAFDLDGSGKISADELRKILGSEDYLKDKKYWEKVIKEVDKNGDGEIDTQEFFDMMKKNQRF